MMICEVLANCLADELLDLGDSFLGFFDAGAAGRPDIDLERAGIDLGEELAAQPRAQPAQRRHQQPDRDQHHGESIVHHAIELADVPADPGFDQGFPPREKAPHQAAASSPPIFGGRRDPERIMMIVLVAISGLVSVPVCSCA